MGPITLKNGKQIKPSYTKFLADYGKTRDYDGIFDAQRGYISKSFYNLSMDERLDLFEIYLEYFFRQIYESYMTGDNKLGEPRVEETRICTEIRSSIEGSGYDFMFEYGRYAIGSGVREIYIAIVDDVDDYKGYRAAIGFTSEELCYNKKLANSIRERMQLVFKSIVELNPEMAAWYMLQGINFIEDAYYELGGNV